MTDSQNTTLVEPAKTRDAIREAVNAALSHRFDGPGLTWRGYLLATLLTAIADAHVLYPQQEAAVRKLAKSIDRDADDNLDEEWPQ
jgi:hypothetical protein